MEHLLVNALAALAAQTGGALTEFALAMRGLEAAATEVSTLPSCAQLPAMAPLAYAATRPVVDRLISAAPALRWQQSYSQADGFDRHYLDNYAWVNLISPAGLFQSDAIRISLGYWGAGLDYVPHSHAPEEFYLVLAGRGVFHSHGKPAHHAVPGDVIHHAPHQVHSFQADPGPLLLAAFWRGEGLNDKPVLHREAGTG